MHLNDFCSYCGHEHTMDSYPRTCQACSNITFSNPLPVGVLLIQTPDEKLLVGRRNIEPSKGKLGLTGGFIETGETWQQAVVREAKEEIGLDLDVKNVKEFIVRSNPRQILIFATYEVMIPESEIRAVFKPNSEVTEIDFIDSSFLDDPTTLAFPLHCEAAERYFRTR